MAMLQRMGQVLQNDISSTRTKFTSSRSSRVTLNRTTQVFTDVPGRVIHSCVFRKCRYAIPAHLGTVIRFHAGTAIRFMSVRQERAGMK